MTYNVRRCTGLDGRVSTDRIAEVIRRQAPDVVAVQEVDVHRRRTHFADQPEILARETGMKAHFHARLTLGTEQYGIALLTPHPMEIVKSADLPDLGKQGTPEKTSAIWARVNIRGRTVQVLTTHFAHNYFERRLQIDTLSGPEWLTHPEFRPPFAICGDLNTPPFSHVYRRMSQIVSDCQRHLGPRIPVRTWPSFLPIVRIDHIFVSNDLQARVVTAPYSALTAVASDHLPLVADLAHSPA